MVVATEFQDLNLMFNSVPMAATVVTAKATLKSFL